MPRDATVPRARREPGITLDRLVASFDVPPSSLTGPSPSQVVVSGLSFDSRTVAPGDVFFCLEGSGEDGHAFAGPAVARGAVAVVAGRPVAVGPGVAVVTVDGRGGSVLRRAMALAASEFYRHPSRSLDVVGVTGTNGKTTVTHLLSSILGAAGRTAEVMGTLTQALTTPEAPELTARLADMVAAGVDSVAMEVSSHALALDRVAGTRFVAGVFTNLSRDHLDFHPSMEDYFEVKARLFAPGRCPVAVVGVDDRWGEMLRDRIERTGAAPAVTYSMSDAHDLRPWDGPLVGPGSMGPGSMGPGWRWTWRGQAMELALPGRHNVANALAAARTVPGRFEPVRAGQPFAVIVDFAHTPDALDVALTSARGLAGDGGRVTVVFGCGGDRDPGKRPAMGAVAARRADFVVVTTDNPRTEDPAVIADQVLTGTGSVPVVVELDRRRAIAAALGGARPGDVVVVAGKGHETYQDDATGRHPFDDRVVVAELLAAMGHGPADRREP